jgi:hypothetical protein
VIYLPDSTYDLSAVGYVVVRDGVPFDEIVSRLRTEFGPPAPTIGAIMHDRGGSDWDVDGYFIDDFRDLD